MIERPLGTILIRLILIIFRAFWKIDIYIYIYNQLTKHDLRVSKNGDSHGTAILIGKHVTTINFRVPILLTNPYQAFDA